MKVTKPNPEQLYNLLNRGVEDVIVREELAKRLEKGERLRVYHGIDPTGPLLHLGHAVTLRKLRQFQDLGHEVILLIGDFTAQIGDPTGRTTERVPLTPEQVKENAKNYQKQAAKILDFKSKDNPVQVKFNSDWLSKLSFKEVVQLAMQFTVQQMIERDMFQVRLKDNKPIGLHEFLYPLMQGYDSVAMDVDLEVGGSDQLFNMLAGRDLIRNLKNKSKCVLTTPLLEGLDGRKMSKSYGNFVAVTDEPNDMFGKVMSLRDELITRYFEICTDVGKMEINKIADEMKHGGNPRDSKLKLGHEIVSMYHGKKAADEAQKNFANVFQKGELPSEIPVVKIKKGEYELKELLVELKLAKSKGEAFRVVKEKGVKVDGQVVEDPLKKISIGVKEVLVQKGKLHYIKVVAK